jgi:hypothetical protein
MKKAHVWVWLSFGLVALALFSKPVLARPLLQGGSSGSFGDPGDMYLSYTLTGADFKEVSPGSFEGQYNGGAISLSGTAIVSRAVGFSSWVSLNANIMDQRFHFPTGEQYELVEGRSEEISYGVSYTIPPDYPHDNVNGSVKLEVCGQAVCSEYNVKFVVWLPDEPVNAPVEDPTGAENPSGEDQGLPLGAIAGGVAVVAVGGAALVLGGYGAYNLVKARRAQKPIPRQPSGDPEAGQAVQAWEQAARQAEQEAEKYTRQWEVIQASGDPNDPAYQALQQQYRDYIDYQRQQAAQARQKAGEIDALEQDYQQELHQQQAYRRHRQAENDFIQRESQRLADRQGGFDRQLDQAGQEIQQKLNQHKAARKADRERLRKELKEARQKVDQAEASQYTAAGVIPGFLESAAEWVQWGADNSLDLITQVTPAAKPVNIAYKGLRGAASGAGNAWSDKQNWKSHLATGIKNGIVDAGVYVIKDRPLNYLPTRLKNFVKPEWVNLPTNTPFLAVKPGEWFRGFGQFLISKARGEVNPIVIYGKQMRGIRIDVP